MGRGDLLLTSMSPLTLGSLWSSNLRHKHGSHSIPFMSVEDNTMCKMWWLGEEFHIHSVSITSISIRTRLSGCSMSRGQTTTCYTLFLHPAYCHVQVISSLKEHPGSCLRQSKSRRAPISVCHLLTILPYQLPAYLLSGYSLLASELAYSINFLSG
jgi:hypothetical protein